MDEKLKALLTLVLGDTLVAMLEEDPPSTLWIGAQVHNTVYLSNDAPPRVVQSEKGPSYALEIGYPRLLESCPVLLVLAERYPGSYPILQNQLTQDWRDSYYSTTLHFSLPGVAHVAAPA